MASIEGNVQIANAEKEQVVRNLANFRPDRWGNLFTTFVLDTELMARYDEQVGFLKEQVRAMVVAIGGTRTDEITLIDKLERLGLSYHYEMEIEEKLEKCFLNYEEDSEDDYDLAMMALCFRIFRQHGHKISTDVFNKFRDIDGKFKETLCCDVMGLLNLYEAAHIRLHGEVILEDALSFTKEKLMNCLQDTKLSPFLAKQVKHSLEQSLHRANPRIETRHFISICQGYNNNSSENCDILLRFAKLDFNRVQLLHKQELCELTRWWNDILQVNGFTHVRDRAAESYLWASSPYFEPHYSLGRVMMGKVILTLTLTDDTYDAYGTFEELQHFTDAIERWDINTIDDYNLSTYMKKIYRAIVIVFAELEADLVAQGKPYAFQFVKEVFIMQVRAYQVETKWLMEGHIPNFDEYLVNALRTSMDALNVSSFMGLENDCATVDAFQWISSRPRIGVASSFIGRLLDDVVGYKHEHERGHIATSIDCYMKQYEVSEQEATKELYELIENAWIDINEEMLANTNDISKCLLQRILNLTRSLSVIYKSGVDRFTVPNKSIEADIRALFVDPVSM